MIERASLAQNAMHDRPSIVFHNTAWAMRAAHSLLAGSTQQFSAAILAASQGLEDHHDDSPDIRMVYGINWKKFVTSLEDSEIWQVQSVLQ